MTKPYASQFVAATVFPVFIHKIAVATGIEVNDAIEIEETPDGST